MTRTALGIFARAPRAGATKTRLVPALGPRGAAALYEAFLTDTFARCAATADVFDATVWVADEADEPTLDDPTLVDLCAALPRRAQIGPDLGARMAAALERGLQVAPFAVVIGTDVPTLPTAYLRQVPSALQGADVVLGPSSDGGYYLVAARERVPPIFEAIRWSSVHTLADTLAAARRAHLTVRLLPPWYDVDEPADLRLLRAHLAVAPDAAPATAHYLGFPAAPR